MACLVNTHPCFQEWIKEGLKSVRKMKESGSGMKERDRIIQVENRLVHIVYYCFYLFLQMF